VKLKLFYVGLTQNCSGKAKHRRQYTEYGEVLERRLGGFAKVLLQFHEGMWQSS